MGYDAIDAGLGPANDPATYDLGVEGNWGVGRFAVGDTTGLVPSAQRDYAWSYDNPAIVLGGCAPVPSEDGVAVLRGSDAARQRLTGHRIITIWPATSGRF